MCTNLEASPTTLVTKKLCNMIRIAYFMIRKGVTKTKFMPDLHLMVKKRGKILGKAFNDLLLEHEISCKSQDVHMSFISPVSCLPYDVHTSFISPREYEFSCSHSPTYAPYKHYNKHRTHHNRRKRHAHNNYEHTRHLVPPLIWDGVAMASSAGDDDVDDEKPVVGFGWSPVVRQVRITDSPFSLRNNNDDQDCCQLVDREAEKFIERFHRELRLQKWMAVREAADYYYG